MVHIDYRARLMITTEQRLKDRDKEVVGLSRQIQIKENVIVSLRIQLETMRERATIAENNLSPVRDSLNRMTAENSRYKRKLKRAGING